MSNTVIANQSGINISPREALVKTILNLWQTSIDGSRTKKNRNEEVRKFLAAIDTTTLEESGLDNWKNKTDIPILYWVSINLKSQYLNALFPRDDWFAWRAENPEDKAKAKLFLKYLKPRLRQLEFEKLFARGVKGAINYGDSLFIVEDMINPDTLEVTPIMRLVPFNNWFMDPHAEDFYDSFCIIKSWKSITEVLEDPTLDLLDKSKFKEFIDTGEMKDYIDFYKQNKLSDDGFISLAIKQKTHVECLDFYGDVYNPDTGKTEKNRRITIINRLFLGRNIEKEPNLVHLGYEQMDDSPYSFGALEKLLGMQYMINKMENSMADVLDQIIHPVTVIKGNAPSNLKFGPGKQWRVGSESDVEFARPPDLALTNISRIEKYTALMMKISGARDENVGIRSKGEKTAFEVDLLQQGSNILHNNFVRSFERSIDRLLSMLFKSFVKSFKSQIFVVIDEITGEETQVQFTDEDAKAKGMFKALGSTELLARAELVQRLQTLLANRAQDPTIKLHTSGYEIIRELEKAYDLEHTNIFGKYKGLDEDKANELFIQTARKEAFDTQRVTDNLGLTGAPEPPPSIR